MKPMVWRPEENDYKVNQYLDHMNHAPYFSIMMMLLVGFCLFSLMVLLASF